MPVSTGVALSRSAARISDSRPMAKLGDSSAAAVSSGRGITTSGCSFSISSRLLASTLSDSSPTRQPRLRVRLCRPAQIQRALAQLLRREAQHQPQAGHGGVMGQGAQFLGHLVVAAHQALRGQRQEDLLGDLAT